MPTYRIYGLSAELRSTASIPFGVLATQTYRGNDALRKGLHDWQEVLTVQVTHIDTREKTT